MGSLPVFTLKMSAVSKRRYDDDSEAGRDREHARLPGSFTGLTAALETVHPFRFRPGIPSFCRSSIFQRGESMNETRCSWPCHDQREAPGILDVPKTISLEPSAGELMKKIASGQVPHMPMRSCSETGRSESLGIQR